MSDQDLLSLRLGALRQDIEKVGLAVTRAQDRGRDMTEASKHLKPCVAKLDFIHLRYNGLVNAKKKDDELAQMLEDWELTADISLISEKLEQVIESVQKAYDYLKHATEISVSVHPALQNSLTAQCNDLKTKIRTLHDAVEQSGPTERKGQWDVYHELLHSFARPLFMEYVDFLGGLTVRDTGLDDRVCEMTGALLTRFKTITSQTLPLPARQAALGTALDGLVLLGFPEWSIWGIPLVGHEIGLRYTQSELDRAGLAKIIEKFVDQTPRIDDEKGSAGELQRAHAEEYLHQLIADALGTYILGFSYACAALLLRLDPCHDEAMSPNRPRDLERARVILLTLEQGSDFGTSSEANGVLADIWYSAVESHAGPGQAQAARKAAVGPPKEKDWFDEFVELVVGAFAEQKDAIPRYDDERWDASVGWRESLGNGPDGARLDGPNGAKLGPLNGNAVCDVLNAAWYLRLIENKPPEPLANHVIARWSSTRKGN